MSERICTGRFTLGGKTVNVISGYAPTLKICEAQPYIRENFYSQLEKTIRNVPKHNILVVVGDFNAKTGTGHCLYPENVGKFGKGTLNSSGEVLLELLSTQDLVISNSLFQP